ncbi:MAG: WG repeat-containing protein [Burkholderia sp.]|jgi:hypothetical protein
MAGPILAAVCTLMITGAALAAAPQYKPYFFDNGPDPVREGMSRIVDENGRIGYVNAKGEVVIKPTFAFGMPFENGRAKVTDTGVQKEVPGSNGEYHYWESDHWYCIDRSGKIVE